jgi:hypothetical protein
MQDVNMGDVCLPGAILAGIRRDNAQKLAKSRRAALDLP